MEKNEISQMVITWGFRKKTLKESTEDLIVFLERLKRFDTRLGVWFEGGMTKKEALKNRVNLDYDCIKKIFCKKCDDNDNAKLSFKLKFWNGDPVDLLSYSIIISIGGFRVGNNVIMFSFPKDGEIYKHYCIKENWENLLELFIDHWKPDNYRDFDDNLIEL